MARQLVDGETALAGAARQTAALLRSDLDPDAPVPGLNWSAAETAAHLVADLRDHAALASGAHRPSTAASAPADGRNAAERGAAVNQAQLDSFSERKLAVLGDLLEEAAAGLNAAVAHLPNEEPIITANGVKMTPSTLVSICLGEQLIHGLDLARAAGRPWPIDRADAQRVIRGIMSIAADYVDQEAANGLHLDYELRFGPEDRYRFVLDGARIAVSSADSRDDRPDCVITADPVAFLLVGYGRVGQWSQILRGKVRAGGRRPWLALRFSSLLIRP